MADFFILALTVFTFQNNTKIAINIHLLEIFALLLVFSNQFTAKCLSLPPPLLGGAISKILTLPFALAFRTSQIETVIICLNPQTFAVDTAGPTNVCVHPLPIQGLPQPSISLNFCFRGWGVGCVKKNFFLNFQKVVSSFVATIEKIT